MDLEKRAEWDRVYRDGRELERALLALGLPDAAATVRDLLTILAEWSAEGSFVDFTRWRDQYQRLLAEGP